MRRFAFLAVLLFGVCAPAVQAQVVAVQITRPYTPIVLRPQYLPPIYYPQVGVVQVYPMIAPSYAATTNIYPSVPVTYSYFAGPAYPYPVPTPGFYSASYYSRTGIGPFGTRAIFSQMYGYP